jgi:hypothetical protein
VPTHSGNHMSATIKMVDDDIPEQTPDPAQGTRRITLAPRQTRRYSEPYPWYW